MSKKRQAKRRAKAKARDRGRVQQADPASRRSRLAELTAEMEERRAGWRAARFSPEVKALLRACPELTVFEREIPGYGTFQIGIEEVLEQEALERYYDRYPLPGDDEDFRLSVPLGRRP